MGGPSEDRTDGIKRGFFLVVNLIFWLFGLCLIILGLWIYNDKNEFGILARQSFNPLSNAAICVACGVTIVVVGFVGFVGVLHESRIFLTSYVVLVAMLWIVNLLTGTLGLLNRDRIAQNVKQDLLNNIRKAYISKSLVDSKGMRFTWDHLQTEFGCCGAQNYTDWFHSPYWPKNKYVPDSCCDPSHFEDRNVSEHCGQNFVLRSLWYQTGCHQVFTNWVFRHGNVVVMFSFIGVAINTVVFITGLRILLDYMKRDREGYLYRRGVQGADNMGREEAQDIHENDD